MRKLQWAYERLVPEFLKQLIDPVSTRTRRFVQQAATDAPTGALVLDAGAGECHYRKYFPDQSYLALDSQRGDVTWDYSHIDILADLSSIPIRDASIHIVICTQVLEHVEDPKAVLQECSRILKSDGRLYLTAPQGWGEHQSPHDYFRFTSHALRHLCREANLEVASLEPICGYFCYLANRMTVFPKVLFWKIKRLWLRLLLLPLEIMSYLIFVILLPILLNAMDPLDRYREYTLNYKLVAIRKRHFKEAD